MKYEQRVFCCNQFADMKSLTFLLYSISVFYIFPFVDKLSFLLFQWDIYTKKV